MTETRSKATQARELRDRLKEQGLEQTVRTMTVPERGDARKLMRDALKVYADLLEPSGDE
ncbi:MAG: hypothetical protein JWN75_1224 [Candidatus Saccharibacteria bacterium]|nr:hypothetical protein [Candidatus Saccharibacteria bacterium]MDB5716421.1 hypothetical protein [Sphingomonadales bacterium]